MKISKMMIMMILLTYSVSAGKSTTVTTIKGISAYKTGAVIKLVAEGNNEFNCKSPYAKSYYWLDFSNNDTKEIYSTLLSAFMSNTNVILAYSGCDMSWGEGIPNIYRVDLLK